jgi:hypothetical protein
MGRIQNSTTKLIHQKIITWPIGKVRHFLNIPVREPLEEETVCDLGRGSDKYPSNEVDNKRGLRGLGSQHPCSLA